MKNENTTVNVLDFEDPGTLTNELMNVPGFVNELKNHTLTNAPRPNEPLAFAGALAMLAHLSGRSYVDERGSHTNLYIAALAPTGMGKDEPRVTNKHLAAKVGILESVPDSIASGEGLEDAVAASPSLLLQTDEADTLLTAMRGTDSRAARMNEMVLRFFSEAKSGHAMRIRVGQTAARVIPQPHLTLFATGIPRFVYASLTPKALENGLLGRCLFIETNEFQPLGEMRQVEFPQGILISAKAMAERERRFTQTGTFEPVIVGETPEAKLELAKVRLSVDETSRQLFERNLHVAAALYCRLYEKAVKLAMLWAISAHPESPRITAEAVAWATRFATHVTRKMLFEAQFTVAEGRFDQLKKRFLGLLSKAGGQLDRSTLLRSLKIDASLFKRIVATLHLCDMIEEETISRRTTIYTLKTDR